MLCRKYNCIHVKNKCGGGDCLLVKINNKPIYLVKTLTDGLNDCDIYKYYVDCMIRHKYKNVYVRLFCKSIKEFERDGLDSDFCISSGDAFRLGINFIRI